MPITVTVATPGPALASSLPLAEHRLIPADVLDRLLNDENPIRIWREHRGLSMSAVSEKSGLAESYLIELECNEREPSLWVLGLIAKAIAVSVEDLIG